jgi:DNA-binding transcriptional ArsR family regulator
MSPVSSLLLAPGRVRVEFALDPVYNNLASLYMVALVEGCAGFDEWVERTAAGLTGEQRRTHRLLFDVLYSAFEPDEEWPGFPAYLARLAEQDPLGMRNRFLRHMFPEAGEGYAARERLIELERFVSEIDRSEFDQEVERELLVEAHTLLGEPEVMRERIAGHLRMMWEAGLAAEWERNRAGLEEVVAFLQGHSYAGQNGYEAIRAVTGRDVQGCWERVLAPAERLIFIPSAHIGPYLMHYAYGPVVRVLFGPRLPEGVERGPAELSRADLLVQLRALADETRLRILELTREEGEVCAQEVIERLGLSKSSASRHLSQLSATGYLLERQGSGKSKCYRINAERFGETVGALEGYGQA